MRVLSRHVGTGAGRNPTGQKPPTQYSPVTKPPRQNLPAKIPPVTKSLRQNPFDNQKNRMSIILEILLFIKLTWGFQESLSSIIMPKNLVSDLRRIWES